MRIGIDFGTSYSAAGAVVDGQLEFVRFGSDLQFRTTVYFPLSIPDIGSFELTPALERQVAQLAAQAAAYQREQVTRAQAARADAMRLPVKERPAALAMIATPTEQSLDQLRRQAIAAVRRQWLAEQARRAQDEAGLDLHNALYGDEAADAYIASGNGHLVVSPKSMLGFRMSKSTRSHLLGITTHILRHIRQTAANQLGTDVRTATIGRPVRFRSVMGEAGGVQAQEILLDAAHAAGFDDVEFLQEPAAAAIGLHQQLQTPRRTLVVDIGGGTSDLALANVGGSAPAPVVLGSWGDPVGGTDVDIELSMRTAMPAFGKGLTELGNHHFYAASAAQDVERQASFRATSFDLADEPFRSRLKRLQRPGNTVRLNRTVEGAKIQLSQTPSVDLDLSFVEAGLAAQADREKLNNAAHRFLHQIRNMVRTALAEMKDPPELVYLTGGMSRSPYIRQMVSMEAPSAEIIEGNASLGVVTGLAGAAASR